MEAETKAVIDDAALERKRQKKKAKKEGSSSIFFFQEDTTPLKLEDLRSQLIRQEETIIFALIERAQFKSNPTVYKKDTIQAVKQKERVKGKSFLDFFLCETEKVHSLMRRYTSPDEHAFFPDELEEPILPLLSYSTVIQPNNINFNPKIYRVYLEKIIPMICEAADDSREYGSSANCDINALQAISKRIHYGKFVAEAKFQAQKELYSKLIRESDAEGLNALLTNAEVEQMVLERVRLKTLTYGRDINQQQQGAAKQQPNNEEGERDTYKVDPDAIVAIYRDIVIPITKEVQVAYLLQRLGLLKVGFLGPRTSYSHQAAIRFFGDESRIEFTECASFHDVFQAVLSNKTSFGILPIENSTTGRVHQALHLFFDTAAKVCGETYLKVSHNLLMTHEAHDLLLKGVKYEKGSANSNKKRRVVLDKIYSHPQVLEQCAKYLQDRFPGVTLVSVASSSKAAEIVNGISVAERQHEGSSTTNERKENEEAKEQHDDVVRVCAALGSAMCVKTFKNLKIVEAEVQDDKNNTTRFLVIGKKFGSPSGKDKTLLTFGVRHTIGSLSTALSIFTRHGINLCGIESYPDKLQKWAYNFLVELDGHVEDKQVATALEELKEHTDFINIIGSFPQDLLSEQHLATAPPTSAGDVSKSNL